MLLRYSAWANDLIFAAIAKLPEGEATRARPTIFGTMASTLNHNHVIDLIWQAHLQGRDHGFKARNTETHPPLPELHLAQRQLDAWYVAYADRLDAAALAEVVDFTFVGGGPGSMSRGDILLHVVTHKSYHRGFVADMICQVAARPPIMDLPVFLREVPLDLS